MVKPTPSENWHGLEDEDRSPTCKPASRASRLVLRVVALCQKKGANFAGVKSVSAQAGKQPLNMSSSPTTPAKNIELS